MSLFKISKEELGKKVLEMSEKLGVKLTNIFVSYHLQSKDLEVQGFGNGVLKFPVESYKDNLGGLIEDLQKAIEKSLKSLYKKEFEVKILFFR